MSQLPEKEQGMLSTILDINAKLDLLYNVSGTDWPSVDKFDFSRGF